MRKQTIKPFNHTPASSFFRLACRVDFVEAEKILPDAELALKAFAQYEAYSNGLKSKKRKRTGNVRGRRASFERTSATPFKKETARIFYGIAVKVERTLEKHYQIKSGETYVVLLKAASLLFLAVSQRVETAMRANTANQKKGE